MFFVIGTAPVKSCTPAASLAADTTQPLDWMSSLPVFTYLPRKSAVTVSPAADDLRRRREAEDSPSFNHAITPHPPGAAAHASRPVYSPSATCGRTSTARGHRLPVQLTPPRFLHMHFWLADDSSEFSDCIDDFLRHSSRSTRCESILERVDTSADGPAEPALGELHVLIVIRRRQRARPSASSLSDLLARRR